VNNSVPAVGRRQLSAWAALALVAALLAAAGSLSSCQLFNRGSAAPIQQVAEETPPAAFTPSVTAGTELTPPAISEAASAQPGTTSHVTPPPDLADLQALALDLINRDRQAAGLAPVAWDVTAAALAQRHAEDMLEGQFFSHWNRAGYGPDHRAALDAGMTDAVFENIHAYWLRFDDGRPAPIEDWDERVRAAQTGWMQSAGHRDNILEPAHTHVGVGIAYRPDIGELRMVQEFVNRYVELDPLPADLPVGAEVLISGRLLNGATDPLVNLAHEPFPQPMSLEQLNETSSYTPAAQFYSAPRTVVDGDRFLSRAILDFDGQPGLYHLWIFVTVQGEQVMAAAPIIAVR
jgi:uncharacterized protein YkwD